MKVAIGQDSHKFDFDNKEKKEGGIGQENTINRLELVYGKNYTLDINKDLENEIYRVKIIIPLL